MTSSPYFFVGNTHRTFTYARAIALFGFAMRRAQRKNIKKAQAIFQKKRR